MKKEEEELLMQAWELQHKILQEIRGLAEMNFCLAYGCLRTAETMVDLIAISKIGKPIDVEVPIKNGQP